MTRLTRADFENMTLGQLREFLERCQVSVRSIGCDTGSAVLLANAWRPIALGYGAGLFDALFDGICVAQRAGFFDSAQPFPAAAQTTPSDSIPVGSEGDSSNESKVP